MDKNVGRQEFCVDVAGGNQPGCPNVPVAPVALITTGAIARIPVVLAELALQVNIDATITLPEPAYEIKQVRKKVKVTQCILLQNTNTLFVSGVVRKNIDYTTLACANSEGFCGDLRHCTVDVPWRCATPVTFNGVPPAPLAFNTQQEFQFFRSQDLKGSQFADKDQLLSGDTSEFNQIATEFYNQLPFCELLSSQIVEYDEFLGRRRPDFELPFEERFFTQIEQKMVLFLTFKLLQNQQVAIPAV